MTWQRGFAWIVVGLTAAGLLGSVWLLGQSPTSTHGLIVATVVLIGGVSGGAATLVIRHDRRSALAGLVALPGLLAVSELVLALAPDALARPPGADVVTAASQGAWVLVYVVIALPLLFFPDGRLHSRTAPWLLAAILIDAAVFMVTAATAPGPFLPPNETSPHVLGTMPGAVSQVLTVVSLPAVPVLLIMVVVDLVHCYRGSGLLRRRQFRVLALAATLLPITLLATWLSYALTGRADVVLAIGLTLTYLAVPTMIAIAVTRPDLFDVDRALVAALSRSIIVGGLLTAFSVANILTGVVLSRRAPSVAVAVTAGIAVLLVPGGRRLTAIVDARVYPVRRSALSAIEDLHRETQRNEARPELLQERLSEALGDPALVIAYRMPSQPGFVDADGTPVGQPGTGTDITIGTETVGLLRTQAPISTDLSREIAARAAPLVELVRLRLELRQALLAAEESRARLLRVGYEERVRLERDLHDGAQQRLVALGMALRLAQLQIRRGADLSGVLDEAVAELGTAVSELRQLAHGIRPSCLDDGLVPALSQLVSSMPLPITLRVTTDALSPDVETTAYYVAAEAITNAVKHAGAQHISLDVDAVDGQLHVRVSDDGSGRAAIRSGSGLAGLGDRVAAHGGRLSVDSRRGLGTVVEAVLPCAS